MAEELCRPWSRLAATALAGSTLVLATGGCSMSFPMSGFVDRAPTGSVSGPPIVLSGSLDKEDLRRANAALAVALDPQGNGEHVAWDNPQSGARGSFAASSPPFPKQDRICRAFRARVTVSARDDHRLDGSACRNADGDWVLADIAESKAGAPGK